MFRITTALKRTVWMGYIFQAGIIFVVAVVLVQNASGQRTTTEIDRIRNAIQVERLLHSIDKKRFDLFFIDDDLVFSSGISTKNIPCTEFARSVGARSWTKAD